MGLSLNQQILEVVKGKESILITLPKEPSTDAIASGLALFLSLEKLGKKVKVVCNDFKLPPNHNFLPKSQEIYSDLTALRNFIISVDISETQAEELTYDIKENKLNIFITPKNGFFEKKDVSITAGEFSFDLIFVLDSPDLESLGGLYENNAEFFYQVPIINIDHNPANEHFGQINLVDINVTSISEIVFELIGYFAEKGDKSNGTLDEYVATNLLAGIISKTKSFKSPSVTPKSLAIAGHLISSGARRDEIVKHLYQTKSISVLKLWGRALARIKSDPEYRLIWSLLTKSDFEKSGATEKDLEGIIDELIVNSPEAETVMIFYERGENKIGCLLNTSKYFDAIRVFRELRPEGTKDFTRLRLDDKSMTEAEGVVLEKIKKNIKK